jgi:uncharacterized protein (AIM24 family)
VADTSATSGGPSFEDRLIAGGELLRLDRVVEARKELEAALEIEPEDQKALGLLGLACFRLAAFDQARTVYTRLVSAHPRDASYRLNLGLVHLKLGKPKLAIGELAQARDLDPSMARAIGYLGLALARDGQYAEAHRSFLQAGQDDLAREMEQHLSAEEIEDATRKFRKGSLADMATFAAPPAPAPPPPIPAALAATLPPTAAVAAPVEIDMEPTEPAAPQGDFAATVDAAASDDAAAAIGIVSRAVAHAMPAAAAPPGRGSPAPLSEFATAQLIRPDDGEEPFAVGPGGVLVVRVREEIMSRTEGVIVSGGELAFEPATRRVRGAATREPFGDADRPMFCVSGEGHLVASPLGYTFAALQLDEDVLYLRENLVFGFENRLRWENGHVPGSDANIAVVQFRGSGCVAIRTRRPTLSIKLTAERVLYVDTEVLAGWIGRVVPRVVALAAGGESSAYFVECAGEGVVLLEDPDLKGPPGAPGS